MKITIVTAFLIGLIASIEAEQENVPNINELVEQVSGNVNIPGLEKVNVTEVMSAVEKVEEKLREKCSSNGGPDAYDNAKNASKEMETCLRSLVNVTELTAEMEEAKPKGDLDIVFKKYCQRSPILKRCINKYTTDIEPCLEDKEKETKKYILNITESLLGFICYKEGDRIALFISTGGPECFQSKQQGLIGCTNSTFGTYISQLQNAALSGGEMTTPETLPKFTFEYQQCNDIANFQTCVVKVLEECSDPTPANIFESILNFVKRATPCNHLLKTRAASASEQSANSAANFIVNYSLITILVFITFRYL